MARTVLSPQTDEPNAPLLDVRNLCTYFPIRTGILQRVRGFVKAVDGVSFHIDAGETLGLVGESGCGKTTVGRTILRLIPATSGEVLYRGRNLFELSGSAMRRLRREIQIIFQDPVGSLNPRMRVGRIVGEPLEVAFPVITFGIFMVAMSLLGGKGTLWGPVLGAILFHVIKETTWIFFLGWQFIALGTIIIINIVFFQQGIVGWMQERWPESFGIEVDDSTAEGAGAEASGRAGP